MKTRILILFMVLLTTMSFAQTWSNTGTAVLQKQATTNNYRWYLSNSNTFWNIWEDFAKYYTKTETDGKYKLLTYVPTWTEITGKPNLVPYTGATASVGLGSHGITAANGTFTTLLKANMIVPATDDFQPYGRDLTIQAGVGTTDAAQTASSGGTFAAYGGDGINGGSARLYGGTASNGEGGWVNLYARGGAGTNKNGGSIQLSLGAATGTGNQGSLNITGGGYSLTQIFNKSTATRILNLPDKDGTFAVTSDLNSYVPYTGATANVNLGTRFLNLAESYADTELQPQGIFIRSLTSGAPNGLSGAFDTQGGYIGLRVSTSTRHSKFGIGKIEYQDVTGLATLTIQPPAADFGTSKVIEWPNAAGTVALTSDLATKQNTLVSGTNIKTINGASILGTGDMVITSGSGTLAGTGTTGSMAKWASDSSLTNAVSGTDYQAPIGYTPANVTGANATGTWPISISGNAATAPWTGISGRPTAVSAFTNDAGYLTNANLSNYVDKTTDQTIAGVKTFSGVTVHNNTLNVSNPYRTTLGGGLDLYLGMKMYSGTGHTEFGSNVSAGIYSINFPALNGTIALTSQIPTNNNQLTNGSGYLSSITSSHVTTALGYNPVNPSSLGTAAYSSKTQFWSNTHPNDYYLSNNWDGTYWSVTSNHGAPVKVGYADVVPWTGVSGRPTALSQFTNNMGFISTEADPTVGGHVKAITTGDISTWNAAYSWGNHAGLYVPWTSTSASGTASGFNKVVLRDANGSGYFGTRIYFDDRNQIVGNGTAFNTGTTNDFGLRNDFGRILFATGGTTDIDLMLEDNGNLTSQGTMYADDFVIPSDTTLKKNFVKINNVSQGLSQISAWKFDWKDDGKNDIGVKAQEVQKSFPDLVVTQSNGKLAVKYDKLSIYLLEGIKEQSKVINDQQAQIDDLKSQIKEIKELLQK